MIALNKINIDDFDVSFEEEGKLTLKELFNKRKLKNFELKYNKKSNNVYREYRKGNNIVPEIDLYEWILYYLILKGRDF